MLSTLKMKCLPPLQHCSGKTKKLVRKEGAFVWLKFYVMLMMCNLKQQLNFKYFKCNLTISIFGIVKKFPKTMRVKKMVQGF